MSNDKGRLPPFVPLLKETLESRAWRAMSHGARSLYVSLKARYSIKAHNNGRLWALTAPVLAGGWVSLPRPARSPC